MTKPRATARLRETPAPIVGPETRDAWAKRITDAMYAPDPPKAIRDEFRQLLRDTPDLALLHGTLPSIARNEGMKRFKGAPALEESLLFQLKQLRKDLAGPSATPLEVLLIDAVVLCYQDYFSFQLLYSQRTSDTFTMRDMEQWERVLSSKEARYLRAVGELARVRRLLNLPAPQVNINMPGGQQVNVQGKP